MKKLLLLLVLLSSSLYTFAQMGKSKQELLASFGKERVLKESAGKPGYSGVLFKLDTVSYVQATFKGEKAVMLSYMHVDSMLTEQLYKNYISQNLPQFTPQKKCTLADKTYLLDSKKNQLVIQNHANEGGTFPLIGLTIVTDPAIISSMSEKIRQFCK